MDDFIARVRDLERRAARLSARVGRAEIAADVAEGTIRRRGMVVDSGDPPGGVGPPPITTPCCPGVNLPDVLKLRLPDNTLVDLTHAAGIWTGAVTLSMPIYGSGNPFGTPPSGPWEITFRYFCGPPPWPTGFVGHQMTARAIGFSSSVGLPSRWPGRGGSLVDAYAFSSSFASAGNCNPLNVQFFHQPSIFRSYFLFGDYGTTGGYVSPPWLVYAP